jgi:hypothetical protein
MGTATVAEELAGVADLEDLYRLDASESKPEDDDDAEEDKDKDEDGKEEHKPEVMPQG